MNRCRESVDFSLQCAWLLDAYSSDASLPTQKKSHGTKLKNLILSDELRPTCVVQLSSDIRTCRGGKIGLVAKPTAVSAETIHTQYPLLERDHPCLQVEIVSFRCFSFLNVYFFSICFPTRQAVKKTHQRSRSDATVAVKLSHRRTPSTGSAKNSLGDLNSGRAFDNGCICFDANGPEFARKLACTCHAPRLLPQFEFIKGILSI